MDTLLIRRNPRLREIMRRTLDVPQRHYALPLCPASLHSKLDGLSSFPAKQDTVRRGEYRKQCVGLEIGNINVLDLASKRVGCTLECGRPDQLRLHKPQ